ncbi:MAG TPA: cobalamin-binding protein [Roseateles sp.]|nr:cobalamin-binding protein [Roseateles sp.]HWT54463.1 cobalamin-binding protein [Rhodocyclaceae bacterium]
MKMERFRNFTAAALLLLSAVGAQAEIRVRDDAGNLLVLPAPARRIVSLAPHITETLYAVGAGSQIVAAVEYSDYPEEAKQLPRVGGYSRVDVEAVVAQKPDLVIGWQSGNAPGTIEKLRALGIPVFLSQPNSIDDIAGNLERIGELSGNDKAGREAAARLRTRLALLKKQYSSRAPVRVFYQVWEKPLMTVSSKQIISDVIKLCGGENVFADLAAISPTISVEAVLAANPEVISVGGMGSKHPEWIEPWKQWPRITAVQRGNLFFIDPVLLQRHTPRLLDGAEIMCRQLEEARSRRPQ